MSAARPHHAEAAAKISTPMVQTARLGQKNGRVRIWAKKGTRPRLPADQRYTNAYLFGAICPMGAKGAALMLPFANTAAMQMHLDEISWLRPDWLGSTDQLKVPKNLTIILLPSLNPVENIFAIPPPELAL